MVDVNLAVGSIFGIYKAKSFIGIKGDDMLAAVVAVYGPRTTFVITVRKGVQEFVLSGEGDFVLSKEDIKFRRGRCLLREFESLCLQTGLFKPYNFLVQKRIYT